MDHQPRQAQSHANEFSPITVSSPPSRRTGSNASLLRSCTFRADTSSLERSCSCCSTTRLNDVRIGLSIVLSDVTYTEKDHRCSSQQLS